MLFLGKLIDKLIKIMNKNTKNILKEKITRFNLQRGEIFLKILKSINQNNNISNITKIYSIHTIKNFMKHKLYSSRKHKTCLYTGQRSGVLKGFNFSRYQIKKFILTNKLTNLKKYNR